MKKTLLALALVLLAACAVPGRSDDPALAPTLDGQRSLAILMGFMPGTWEALPNAEAPIRLRMTEFWKGKANENWVYAEYERVGQEGRPFIQRIYRFSEAGGNLSADVYGLPEGGARFVGEWRKAKSFEGLSPSQLRVFENCRLKAARTHEAVFAGGTIGNRCRTGQPDVAYERSEFHLTSSTLRNLEQGYDAAGKRISGDAKPYDLRRMSREAR